MKENWKFLGVEGPFTNCLCGGGYGYFLKLHILTFASMDEILKYNLQMKAIEQYFHLPWYYSVEFVVSLEFVHENNPKVINFFN